MPTPQAHDAQGSKTPEQVAAMRAKGYGVSNLNETVEHQLLPTPKAGDADFGLPRTSGRPPEKSTHLATRLHFTDFGPYAGAIERWEEVLGREAPAPTELTRRASTACQPGSSSGSWVKQMGGSPTPNSNSLESSNSGRSAMVSSPSKPSTQSHGSSNEPNTHHLE